LSLSAPSGGWPAEQGADSVFALRSPGIRIIREMLIVELLSALNVSGCAYCETLRAACRVVIKLCGGLRLWLRGLGGLAACGASGEPYSRKYQEPAIH
jgi:hypothetical protein